MPLLHPDNQAFVPTPPIPGSTRAHNTFFLRSVAIQYIKTSYCVTSHSPRKVTDHQKYVLILFHWCLCMATSDSEDSSHSRSPLRRKWSRMPFQGQGTTSSLHPIFYGVMHVRMLLLLNAIITCHRYSWFHPSLHPSKFYMKNISLVMLNICSLSSHT